MRKLSDITISNRYKLKHYVESNSFCDIYTAIDLDTEQLVSLSVYDASKISRDDLDENNDLREIGFLKLGVDGLPKLIGFGDFSHNMESFRYIATQFISGESVLDRMKRNGNLNEFDASFITTEIAKIAIKLHNREIPVLLNGLSLDNIMIDMSGDTEEIKLRNLINLRSLKDDFKYEYIDGVLANNLAPECFNDVFNTKTDQFHICALLYQMMNLTPLWVEDEIVDFKNKKSIDDHLNNRDYQLDLSENIDGHLRSLLLKALSKNSENRFRNLTEFSSYLNREKLLTSSPTKSNKPKIKVGDGFIDIAGMEQLKERLQTQVLDVLSRPEHFKKYGVTIPNGMLLYGPPGCGKSYISEKFCEEAGFNFFLVKPSDLSSIYVSGGEEKIGQLFAEAEKNSPSVICFDEVDAIMPKRGDDSHQSISARVNEFLAQINKCSDRGIFIIATTNKPGLIDEAMLRTGRLEIQIYVSPPDLVAREKLFELYLKNRYCESDINYSNLASLTDGIVASDVEFIVNQSSHKAAMLDVKISNIILQEVISTFRPSVSKEIIDKYKEDHLNFSNSDGPSERKKIGF